MGWRWFSLWSIWFLLGCGSRPLTERVVIGPILEMHFGEVAVYEMGTAMPISFTEIGFIRARAEGDVANEVVLEQLRSEAASLGANTIVHVHVGRSTDVVVASGVAVHVP